MVDVDRHNFRILVVDGDRDHGDMVLGQLAESGFSSLWAGSGREAVALFKESPFSVVLSELKLPDMAGPQLMEGLKELDPTTAVVFMSHRPSLDTAVSVIQKGAFDLIEKPCSPLDLLATVRRAATRHRELARLRAARKWAIFLIASLPVWFVIGYLLTRLFRA